MRKRVIAAALAAMMAVTGLAGCGGSGTGKEEAKKKYRGSYRAFWRYD